MARNARWLFGWVGIWVVLAALADNSRTEGLASTIAATIAFAALLVNGPRVFKSISDSIGR